LAIKKYCSEKLPPSMTIDRIAVFEKLPLNANGKIDKKLIITSLSKEMKPHGQVES
jgi:non-ribosomal peptide synthetase component E (peptide arylation enzyme)